MGFPLFAGDTVGALAGSLALALAAVNLSSDLLDHCSSHWSAAGRLTAMIFFSSLRQNITGWLR